jgi:lysophospholipase L1-like esterase
VYTRRGAMIGIRTAVPCRVVSEGDSISQAGSGGYNSLYAANHPDLDWHQTAVGGSSIATGTPTLKERQQSDLSWNAEVVSVLIGANDLADTANYASVADWLHALWRYIAPFRAAGAKVVVCTVLPKGTAYSDAATHNARRPSANQGIRDGYNAGRFHGLVDFDTTIMGLDATANNTTYYNADALHPTGVGHAILRPVYAAVMNQMLGLTSWTPLSLGSKLGGWWSLQDPSTLFQDTAATSPITAAGQAIARINDRSGLGRNLLQATSGARPLYQTGGGALGTSPYADFNGSSHFMQTASFTADAQPNYFAAATKLDNNSTAVNCFLFDGIASGNRNALFTDNNGGTETWRMFAGGAGTVWAQAATTAEVLLEPTFNGASSSMRLDGAGLGVADVGTHTLTGLTIGASNAGTSGFYDGRIEEFLFLNAAPSAGEQARMLTFIGNAQGRPY